MSGASSLFLSLHPEDIRTLKGSLILEQFDQTYSKFSDKKI